MSGKTLRGAIAVSAEDSTPVKRAFSFDPMSLERFLSACRRVKTTTRPPEGRRTKEVCNERTEDGRPTPRARDCHDRAIRGTRRDGGRRRHGRGATREASARRRQRQRGSAVKRRAQITTKRQRPGRRAALSQSPAGPRRPAARSAWCPQVGIASGADAANVLGACDSESGRSSAAGHASSGRLLALLSGPDGRRLRRDGVREET